jgi:N-acetylgalactosamine kinase
MTLNFGILVAFAPRTDSLVRVETLNTGFPPAQFENGAEISPSPPGSWENYCKAAVSGLNEALALDGSTGMNLLVWGDIPTAAGLSSSSALVVATALAYLASAKIAIGLDVSRLRLAAILAQAERYVGTQGGGMDQAVILLGGAERACKIDFNPLRVEEVPLFQDHVFVVCDSLVHADKTGSARQRYNEGPVLCRLIRAMVERQAQRVFGGDIAVPSLSDLWFGPLCLLDREVEDLLNGTFPNARTTLSDAARFLDLDANDIRTLWIGDLPEPEDGFPLQSRARHQLTEYQRVEAGRDALAAGDAAEFGRLMYASHESCSRDYFVSCPELDRLVELGRSMGSIGSRLTGAGFGGCTVHLVRSLDAPDFLRRMKREYYEELDWYQPSANYSEGHRFVAVPSAPAGYL